MNYPIVKLKSKHEKRVLAGHLWVFSNEIAFIDDGVTVGDIVKVLAHDGKSCGYGFYNPNSLIAVRIISRTEFDDIGEVIKRYLSNAVRLRRDFYPSRKSYRLVFSESDFLPGLIIDKYNSTFVLQINSAGMEKYIDHVIDFLKEELTAENIFTKNEIHFRQLESLSPEDKIYLGSYQNEIINDGAIQYNVDFQKSQKTGFYFDQSDNRFFIEKICENKKVVDAFCNNGGFGLHAARANAKKIYFIDSSASEIEAAQNNFKLNNFSCEAEFFTQDVFDFLESSSASGKKFDVVMLDPPAFAKNKKNIFIAQKGYEKLNRLGLKCVADGGYLVTSSCSYHVPKNTLLEIINDSARKEGKQLQQIHFNEASLDHPKLLAMQETSYLKFAVFKVH